MAEENKTAPPGDAKPPAGESKPPEAAAPAPKKKTLQTRWNVEKGAYENVEID